MKNYVQALIFSVQFLTRIPLQQTITPTTETARRGLFLFPLVGLLIGLVLWAVYYLLQLTGLSTFSIAVAIILTETAITGAFHLDGLSDTFDALLSPGTDRDEKLAIMKDSRIGVMGATALIFALMAKTALAGEAISGGKSLVLVVYPVAGRWCQVALYGTTSYIRSRGIGSVFSRSAGKTALIVGSLFFAACQFVFFSPTALILCFVFAAAVRSCVRKTLGGITGDILGAATVLTEIVFLFGSALAVPF